MSTVALRGRSWESAAGQSCTSIRGALSEWILQAMKTAPRMHESRRSPILPDLLARHISSTFVLILHWWMDDGAVRSPAEADRLFRALIMPVLRPAGLAGGITRRI